MCEYWDGVSICSNLMFCLMYVMRPPPLLHVRSVLIGV